MKTHSIVKRYTKDFLNTEVKEYAIYVIKSRSLPSIMDGMRIGARKILYAAMTGDLRKVKKDKMPSLIGDTMKLKFHHGDASLKNTIEQLGSEHVFKYGPLEIIGQYGSLRTPDASTAARYLEVAKSPYLDWYKIDSDLFDLNIEEGKKTEPKYFLPIIPITLLWRTNSPGFGFSFRSFSFDLDDIIDATMQSVINGSCTGMNYVQLKPEIHGIEPKNIIYNENKNSWYNVGEYEITGDLIHITALPYNINYVKYNEHLESLKEKNYIVGYRNDSTLGAIDYKIKFANGRLQTIMNGEKFKFFTNLKLFTKIPNLTLNTIDIDGKSIVNFETPNDLIDGFVRRRLNVYKERKTRLITVINESIVDLTDKAKFIQLVVDDKLVLNKRKVSDIKIDCDKFGVSYAGLELKAIRFTQDEINKALSEIEDLQNQLEYINNTSIQQMYIGDLLDFKEKYSQILKPGEKPKVVTYKEQMIEL